jgi:hypothetical protein
LNIYELWRARVEGRFTLRHWLWAWIISSRFFAIPWVFLYTLFGALLAGINDWVSTLGACITTSLVLLMAHFRNNYRDIELGIDKYVNDVEEAEKLCSSIKPYTAAAWVVPLRITPIWFQKLNEYLMLILSLLTYSSLVRPWVNTYTIPIYVLGVLIARYYTDFFKKKGIGEVAAFLGHGFATTTFGYLTQSTNVVHAVLAGLAPGLISGLAYSVDQYVDIKTDFVKRVRNLAEAWFNSKLPLGLYILAVFFYYLHMLTILVILKVYPPTTLITYVLIPLILLISARVEYNREKALRDAMLTAVILIPALMCLGTYLNTII